MLLCVGRRDIVSMVLPTKEQQPHSQQDSLHSDDQFESLPAAAAAALPSSHQQSSVVAVSTAQQSSTNIHLQAAVNNSQSPLHQLTITHLCLLLHHRVV